MGNAADPAFARELHRTLMHLYDPAELRRSPLVDLLGAAKSTDPTQALQRTLLAGIEALKPGAGVPPQSNAWRIYHVLNQRYAGQFLSRDIAANLAVSGRQLRRLQVLALQALADYLWSHHDLAGKLAAPIGGPTQPITAPAEPAVPTREQELALLQGFSPVDPVGAAELMRAALAVAGPLAEASGVRVECAVPEGLPRLATQTATVRHALLNLLAPALRSAEGGTLRISAQAQPGQVWIDLRPTASRPAGSSPLTAKDQENLEMARQLLELAGGALELAPGQGVHEPFIARLILPAAEQVTVLVIDDNADALRLLERYLTGSRYRFAGVQDPRQALAVAEEIRPEVIVLDLMLPGIDGWELLGQLREHPRLAGVPIIVCSILPQEDLALALGAAALVRKPVARETLLAALDRASGLKRET